MTCLSSFSKADMTIKPLQTIGDFSSTRNPIDILKLISENKVTNFLLIN